MATYRIFHNVDGERITTCNNDLELIKFVNRVQTENGDELTYNVDSAIDYINLTCDNLEFVSEDFDGSHEFEFYYDQKHTIWYRTYFTVKANSYEEATEKVSQMYRDNNLPNGDTEILYDTVEEMSVEDNGGASTIEIYTEGVDLVIQNGE